MVDSAWLIVIVVHVIMIISINSLHDISSTVSMTWECIS